jgi:uncharacterized protein YggE
MKTATFAAVTGALAATVAANPTSVEKRASLPQITVKGNGALL